LVVINAITKLGANPIFVDIGRDANMDLLDLKRKITPKTKAIIVQHTFGVPAEIEELTSFAKTHSLPIIEDCAHALGAVLGENRIGTFGDISILSFGSDKIISCVRGGAIVVNNDSYVKKIIERKNSLPDTSIKKIFQHLMHYPIFFLGKNTYHILFGKVLLWTAKKINLTNRIIYNEEKKGEPMRDYPSKLPEALAQILLLQLKRLNTIILHRKMVAKKYEDEIKNPSVVLPCRELAAEKKSGGVYLRYPILTKNPYKLYEHAKNNGIILGNWYDTVVSPYRGVTARIDYIPGSCPNAEYFSKHIVNLPTDIIIGEKEQKRIIDTINSYKEE
jgi:dTDP-4-amino-4,6-dideoxygalactose transaminase